MTDMPEITYAQQDGEPVAVVGRTLITSREDLLARLPGLLEADEVAELARAVAHFAHPGQYRVIDDPATFTATYRTRYSNEDAGAPFNPGVAFFTDFEMPDLARIRPPERTDEGAVFFVEDIYLGYPYKVDVPLVGGALGKAGFAPLPAAED